MFSHVTCEWERERVEYQAHLANENYKTTTRKLRRWDSFTRIQMLQIPAFIYIPFMFKWLFTTILIKEIVFSTLTKVIFTFSQLFIAFYAMKKQTEKNNNPKRNLQNSAPFLVTSSNGSLDTFTNWITFSQIFHLFAFFLGAFDSLYEYCHSFEWANTFICV